MGDSTLLTRLGTLSVALLVLAAACSDDDDVLGIAEVVGDYTLIEANGETPPATLVQFEEDGVTMFVILESGSLSLSEPGNFTAMMDFRLDAEEFGTVQEWTDVWTGSFEMDGNTLVFDFDEAGEVEVSFSAGRLTGTVTDPETGLTMTLVFQQ